LRPVSHFLFQLHVSITPLIVISSSRRPAETDKLLPDIKRCFVRSIVLRSKHAAERR
jgi:hypothetical protein